MDAIFKKYVNTKGPGGCIDTVYWLCHFHADPGGENILDR
jgi:hypothetical protein